MIPWLPEPEDDPEDEAPFPPTARALGPGTPAPGLLAAGGRLSPKRLQMAYSRGIFPWYSPGEPLLWWSTAPRMVLQTAHFRLHRSLRKTLRHFVAKSGCGVSIDQAFEQVLHCCAHAPREGQAGTWIVPEMRAAYTAWHTAGQVHSFETWIDGQLMGGLYGVSLGRMFYGESMFSHSSDASKIALAALVAFCRHHGILWIDCQQQTGHLASLGAQPVSREAFEAHLKQAVPAAPVSDWTYHASMWALLGLEAGAPPSPDLRNADTPA